MNPYRPLLWIALAVFVWSAVHAAGAYFMYHTHDWRRPLVVLVASDGFLAFWLLMLWSRKRRLQRRAAPPDES